MKLEWNYEENNGKKRNFSELLRSRSLVLDINSLLGSIRRYGSLSVKSPISKFVPVMDSKNDPKICSSEESAIDPLSRELCETGDLLPTKSTSHVHRRLLAGCMPINRLRRSASSLRRSPRTTITHDPSNETQNVTSQSSDDVKEHYSSLGVNTYSSHSALLSVLNASDLHVQRKHTSLSESGLPRSPTNPPMQTTSAFQDPILEDLDAELPDSPPRFPRARPFWLKMALMSQGDQTGPPLSSTGNVITPNAQICDPTDPNVFSNLNRNMSCSVEDDRFGIRIYPVMQNGVKMSETHYWLLDPPRSVCSQLQRQKVDQEYASSSIPKETERYLNMPIGANLRREKSEPNRQAWNNMYSNLVRRLMDHVPEATEAECQAVLIGSRYQYEEAQKRLKLELLCRKNYISRSHCQHLLRKFNWDLKKATDQARTAYETRCSQELKRTDSQATSDNQSPPLTPLTPPPLLSFSSFPPSFHSTTCITSTTTTATEKHSQFAGKLDVLRLLPSTGSPRLSPSWETTSLQTSCQYVAAVHSTDVNPLVNIEPP